MMKSVLWISPYAPYDRVRHAGGQIENYYLKGLNLDTELEVTLISFINKGEYNDVKKDLEAAKIKNDIKIDVYRNNKGKFVTFFQRYNSYAGIINEAYWDAIVDSINRLELLDPDVVILQWTEFVLFAKKIKKLFPYAKVILIEEDVSFLKYKRNIDISKSMAKHISWIIRYKILKSKELNALSNGNLVILNNDKDKQLIENNGITKTWRWSPYFNSSIEKSITRKECKDIVFFGAMARAENYEACIWFIENVLKKLEDEFRFVIIGNNPPEKLLKYKNDRVIVTGFVEDVTPYFENALCLAAPLLTGAGIKIKIIEAMSCGLTVLTNHVGIEGIPAKNNISYIHCETPGEYIEAIIGLEKNFHRNIEIGSNGRKMIADTFDFERDLELFKNHVMNI